MFLLSIKAGMRAKEIASVTWAMVTDAEGEIAGVIALENRASKGKGGGRHIPMHPDLKAALIALHRDRGDKARSDMPVVHSERDRGLSAAAVVVWFHRLYSSLGMVGCSSHSGRRSFITRAARKIGEVGVVFGISKHSPGTAVWERPRDTSRPTLTRKEKSSR